MKTKLLLIILISITTSRSFSQSINVEDNVREILAIANSGMHDWLEKIPTGKEALYGFKNREEFALATIGKPYQVKTLSKEFFSDTELSSNKNYLVSTNEYRIPITINGENRVLLTVAKMNGIWETVGLSGAGLAQELSEFEKEHPSSNQGGMMLRVYQLSCDFVLIPDNSSVLNGYPLPSAKMFLGNQKGNNSSYSLPELLTILKKNINPK